MMREFIIQAVFLFLVFFLGFSLYEILPTISFPLRAALALLITYFLTLLFFLVIDLLSRLLLRNAPDYLLPGTPQRTIWGIGEMARTNYLHLLHGLGIIAGHPNIALRLLGLKHGKRFSLLDGQVNDPSRITVGNNVLGGTDATIGERFHPFRGPVDRRPIIIGDNCLIGGKSVIQSGVQIGDNVVVAILSVVSSGSVLESGWVYGGIPAKKIRQLDPDEVMNQ
ncbi:MAG: acyltransferase [Candidatus Hodarchaeota archaeon]